VTAPREWIARLRGTLRPRRSDGDLEQELQLHLELAAEEARRRADSTERGTRTAAIRAGGVPQAIVVAIISAVLVGLGPAFQSTRADLTAVMKSSDDAFGRRRRWGRALLVGGQVAVSVIVLVIATVMFRSFNGQP
jgi:hypothetical protein